MKGAGIEQFLAPKLLRAVGCDQPWIAALPALVRAVRCAIGPLGVELDAARVLRRGRLTVRSEPKQPGEVDEIWGHHSVAFCG